ncbi:MAG: DUF5683 domain-containing protein [Candidatus Marinimicrobia bacterium]|nr:DUF5683 domain-containing protein [Candidatus Neomarinimicrobiota bacterium]
MKYITQYNFFIICSGIFLSSLFGNISRIEQNFYHSLIKAEVDTSDVSSNSKEEIKQPTGEFKSPGKALIYSAMLPGMGQAYTKHWLRALAFTALDGFAIATWMTNNSKAEDKKREYVQYANEHWSFSRWLKDYYKWYEYKPGDSPEDSSWNAIRKVFINYSDSADGCAQDPSIGGCYRDIWDHSHSIEFTFNGSYVSTKGDEFKTIFQKLCDNTYQWDTQCSDLKDDSGDSIFVIKDHHFYEGIQKYDVFFAGWDDNDSVQVVIKPNGDINATSLNQITYRSKWNDYNEIRRLAGNGGKFMLINRAVSMIDALLLAKKWNNTHDIKFSLNAYPDLRNRTGLGGLTLSVHW